MGVKSKRRFKEWVMLGVIAFVLIFMIIKYTAPLLQKLRSLFPAALSRLPVVSKIFKERGVFPEEAITAEEGAVEETEEKIIPVIIHKVARGDFEDMLPAMGTIKGSKEIELRFEINGVVEAINFKEGDFIKRGDIIAVLNQADAILKFEYSQTKLKTAQAQMLSARKKLEIHQKLYQIGSIIKSKFEEVALEYENIKSQVASAEKEVAFAKQEVQKAYLASAIDGIMGTKDVEPGEFITSATKIGTVIDVLAVFAEVGIIEKDLEKVSLDQEATVTVDAYPGAEFKGVIDNILPTIEGKSRTLTCRIKIDNPEGRLLPGMFARAMIFIFGQEDAVVLPNPDACLRDIDNDGTFDSVFVVDADNIAHSREIEVGYLTSENAVIAFGLEDGDLVVAEARGELADGASVEILETQEAFASGESLLEESAEGLQ